MITAEGKITYDTANHTALFCPTVNLAADTQYKATLTSTIQDAQGNVLQGPFSRDFKTASENTTWVRLTWHFRDFLWDQYGDGIWDTPVVDVEVSVLFTGACNLSGCPVYGTGLGLARATTGSFPWRSGREGTYCIHR